jgi:hypothetical protein
MCALKSKMGKSEKFVGKWRAKLAATMEENVGLQRLLKQPAKGFARREGAVRGLVQALWCLAVRVRYLQSDPL